jgi:hypothetical protein
MVAVRAAGGVFIIWKGLLLFVALAGVVDPRWIHSDVDAPGFLLDTARSVAGHARLLTTIVDHSTTTMAEQPQHAAIQRLVNSLLQQQQQHHQKNKRGGGCYQILVEGGQREEDPRSGPQTDWVEAIASAFRAHGCIPHRIYTLPTLTTTISSRHNAAPSPGAAAINKYSYQVWKKERFGFLGNPDDDWKDAATSIGGGAAITSAAAAKTTTTTPHMVMILDSVIPLLHHSGSWYETLRIVRRLRASCHVLLINISSCGHALSHSQIQSLETLSSAILYDYVLLRRGVQEHDQWLREDLLVFDPLSSPNVGAVDTGVAAKPSSTTTTAAVVVGTRRSHSKTSAGTSGGKIFLQKDDPIYHDEEEEDLADDLDI